MSKTSQAETENKIKSSINLWESKAKLMDLQRNQCNQSKDNEDDLDIQKTKTTHLLKSHYSRILETKIEQNDEDEEEDSAPISLRFKRWTSFQLKNTKKGFNSLSNNIFSYMSDFYDTSDIFTMMKINKKFFSKLQNKDLYRMVISIVKNNRNLEYLISNNGLLMTYYLERVNLEDDSLQSNKFVEFIVSLCLRDIKNELKIQKNIGPKGFYYLSMSNRLRDFNIIDFTGNRITDEGAFRLSEILPTLYKLDKLVLSINQLSTKSVKSLFDSLKYHNNIKEINISGNNSFAEGMDAVELFLKRNKSIKILNLSHNTIQDKGAITIAEGLLFCTSITSLDLSNNKITHEGLNAFSEIFNQENYIKIERLTQSRAQSIINDKSLSVNLNAKKFEFKSSGTESIVHDLSENERILRGSGYHTKTSYKISNLDKSFSEFSDDNLPQVNSQDSNHFTDNLIVLKKLNPLMIDNTNTDQIKKKTATKYLLFDIKEEETEEPNIASKYKKEDTLNEPNEKVIPANENKELIIKSQTKSILDSICKSPELKLKHSMLLRLSSNIARDNLVRMKTCMLFDINKPKYSSLERLNLSNNKVENEGAIPLFNKLSLIKGPSLIELNLTNCGLTSGVLDSICNFLTETMSLETLILRQNNFTEQGTHEKLEACILHNTTLLKVSLESCKLSDESVISVFKAIAESNIKEIYLGGNNIDSITCQAMAEVLNFSQLKVLSIPNNDIQNDGLNTLSVALQDNTILEKLNLSMNDLYDESLQYLVSCLSGSQAENKALNEYIIHNKETKRNSKLKELDLSINNFTDEGVASLFNLIAFNDNCLIEHISLSGNSITSESVEDICVAINYSETMRRIDLCENQIDVTSCKKLINSCCISQTMSYLDISKNSSTKKNAAARRGSNLNVNRDLTELVAELLLHRPCFKILY